MDTLLILFCYNRPKILQECIKTLFANSGIEFSEVLLINDGSDQNISKGIVDFVVGNQNHPKTSFNLMHFGKNTKYARTAEFAFTYAKMKNPKYLFWIEQDYIWRKNWAIESLEIIKQFPKSIGLSLFSNPDYYSKEKTEEMFPRIIKEEFGSDMCADFRQYMHTQFEIETPIRKMMVQGTSNCCGTVLVNWQNIVKFSNQYPDFWNRVIERSCNMQDPINRGGGYFSDGSFTHGSSFFYYKHYLNTYNEIDYKKEFPWMDICDFSLAEHINGGGLNSGMFPECSTFIHSPVWDEKYINEYIPGTNDAFKK